MSQSSQLSKKLTAMVAGGSRLNDDSKGSEKTLDQAMLEIIKYSEEKNPEYKITHKKKISLFECQETLEQMGGPKPDPANKKVSMKPDGGYIFAKYCDKLLPLLIVEDKRQGTNDNLHTLEKPRQATGNAIERAAKNIRGSEMLFAPFAIFPYVIFASGCDFHHNETISKRLEMMNYGCPNHYIEITSKITQESIDVDILEILTKIDIRKRWGGRSVALVFIKAHKWDEMGHGSSAWTKDEEVRILKTVIDQVFEYYATLS